MKTKRIVYIFIYIVWIILIFVFSSQTGIVSSHASKWYVDLLTGFFARFDVTVSALLLTTIVRKSAHFTEYAVLGYVTRRNADLNGNTLFYLSGFVPFLDEAFQTQIAGRVGSITDSLIDMSGYLTGILIAQLLCKRSVM